MLAREPALGIILAADEGAVLARDLEGEAAGAALRAGTRIGAAALLKGMTAEFLLRRCYTVKAGETILVHAAAGGVGSILVQWAKHLGATVIATAGSEAKAERDAAKRAEAAAKAAAESTAPVTETTE